MAFKLFISTKEALSFQLSVYSNEKELKTCEKIATEFLVSIGTPKELAQKLRMVVILQDILASSHRFEP